MPIRTGIGTVHDDAGTKNAEAQRFYDQGLAYLHNYVWIEAARSFHQALRLDPQLALAHVGLSYAYVELNKVAQSRQAIATAQALAAKSTDHVKRHVEARALGVHSGMGLMKAAALAADAVLLPADFDEYRKYSRLFKAAVAEVAPLIEDRGIDEIYIDLSDVPGAQDATEDDPYAGVRVIAERIKARVYLATGLGCSMGVTPNKLLSKIGSELDKPNGLTILTDAELQLISDYVDQTFVQ